MARKPFTRRGANALEFALVLPVLVLMLMGIMEWGWYFHNELNIVSTARYAARVGATTRPPLEEPAGSCTDCLARARASAYELLAEHGIAASDSAVDVNILNVAGSCAIEVTIDIPYAAIAGMIPIPSRTAISVTQPLEFVNGC